MLGEIIGAIVQVLVFTLIPFLVYLVKKKTLKGFLASIGLKKSNIEANLLAVLASLILVIPMLLFTLKSDSFREIMFNPHSITGKLREMGVGTNSIIILLIVAIFKTSFAEEILFRGFIGKGLINSMGFIKGNTLQAIIFGVLHLALFATITLNLSILSIIFISTALIAYVFGYLNEKKANGSIIPSWIAHALANTATYICIGFLM